MEKRESLQLTRVWWQWLAENPTKGKLDWPDAPTRRLYNDCPLCQFANMDCDKCPLLWKWTAKEGGCCADEGSPYKEWYLGKLDLVVRVASALRIVALCDEALVEGTKNRAETFQVGSITCAKCNHLAYVTIPGWRVLHGPNYNHDLSWMECKMCGAGLFADIVDMFTVADSDRLETTWY